MDCRLRAVLVHFHDLSQEVRHLFIFWGEFDYFDITRFWILGGGPEEQSWEVLSDSGSDGVNSRSRAEGGEAPTPTTTNRKRLHAELTPQQGEDTAMGGGDHDHHNNNNNNNVGAGRVTRARVRAQQEPQAVEEEDSFEVPGLMSTRRRAPPNKVARRK